MQIEEVVAQLGDRVAQLETEIDVRLTRLEQRIDAVLAPPAGHGASRPGGGDPRVTLDDPFATGSFVGPPAAPHLLRPPPPPPRPPAPRVAPPPPRVGDAVVVGPPASPPADTTPRFEVGLEALLRWAGVVLVGLAAVFLVSAAINRGWIGPELQLAGAALIGVGLLATAFRLGQRRRSLAHAVAVGGSVVLTVSAAAGYRWLELYGPVAGLALVTVCAAGVMVVASLLRMEWVAIASSVTLLVVPTWASILVDAPFALVGAWLGGFAVAVTVVGMGEQWVRFRLVSTWAVALWLLGTISVMFADGDSRFAVPVGVVVVVVAVILWLNPALTDHAAGRAAARTAGAADGAGGRAEAGATPGWFGDRLSVAASERISVSFVPLWTWLAIAGVAAPDRTGTVGDIGLVLAGVFLAAAVAAGVVTARLDDQTTVFHLLGAGALASLSVVALLDGPALVVVVAFQALVTLLAGSRFGAILLRIQAHVLAGVAAVLVVAGMAEAARGTGVEAGPTLAHGVSLVFLAGVAHLTERYQGRDRAEPLHGAVGVGVILFVVSVAAPLLRDRPPHWWLLIGLAATVVMWAAARRFGPWVLALAVVVGGLTVAGTAVAIGVAAADGAGVFAHLANLAVVMALVLATVGVWWRRPVGIGTGAQTGDALFVASWIGSLGWIASVLLALPQGQVAVSAAWAAVAVAALVVGIRTDVDVVRWVGLATLATVLVKLFTVDLAAVDTLWRIGLFLAIGVGLLRLGYVLPGLSRRPVPDDPDQ